MTQNVFGLCFLAFVIFVLSMIVYSRKEEEPESQDEPEKDEHETNVGIG